MYKFKSKIIIPFVLLSFGGSACKEKPLTASIIMIRGNVTVTPENTNLLFPAKLGTILNQGETIQTGNNSAAILNIKETGSFIEIQSNALFRITSIKKSRIELFSEKGNIWVKTQKKSGAINADGAGSEDSEKENYFKVVTPTMVAAVRGTTFYVFNIGDMEGVCHCDGSVEFSRSRSSYRGEHHTDNMVISRGDKSVLLTPDDLKKIGLQHNHSVFEKSPVGPQNQLTEKEFKTFVAFFNKKLAEKK